MVPGGNHKDFVFSAMQRLLQILFWSIISAAFIGPGTVTTAASAGSLFRYDLIWALLFSTIACIVLQEASARITIISGWDLGQAIRKQFQGGILGFFVLALVLSAIILGCAAYETGNILGSVAGISLCVGIHPKVLTLIIGISAGFLLYFGTVKIVARLLGVIVAFMGVAFLVTAILLKPPVGDILIGTFVPTWTNQSSLFVIALIGTTVVPYNLFLGSGIAKGQKIGEVRLGLTIAIFLGGIISMGVLVVGTAISESHFTFETLSDTLSTRLGNWSGSFFAMGLFAAGFSSAVTAPLAAAITAQSLLDSPDHNRWHQDALRYRIIWMGILIFGTLLGLMDIRPIPAIILAQALNGVLLPFAAVFLFLVVNDRTLMGEKGINRPLSNIVMGIVITITIILGIANLVKAAVSTFPFRNLQEQWLLIVSGIVTIVIIFPLMKNIRKRRFLQTNTNEDQQ